MGCASQTAAISLHPMLDEAAGTTFTKQSEAVNYTTDAGVKVKYVVFEIGAYCLAAGFDCVAIETGASHAANITSATLYVEQHYQGASAAVNPLVD